MNWHKSRLILVICCSITIFSVGFALTQHIYYAFYAKGSYPIIRHKYIPQARLVDVSGNFLQDNELRRGKVILVLLSSECEACLKDGQFLKAVISKYSNIRFYGALLFWSEITVDHIEDKFPMKLFYDQDALLRHGLGVKSTPMKIYLEDGDVKKVWVGTPITPQAESAFIKEIDEISSK